MSVVIDASAVLAILFDERGADVAARSSRSAFLSAVNLIEVREKFARKTGTAAPVAALLETLGVIVAPFEEQQAILAAELKGRNDSLADRACLALAATRGLPVVSADRAWADLDVGVEIRLIR